MSRAVVCDRCGKVIRAARNARAAANAARGAGARLQPGRDCCRACMGKAEQGSSAAEKVAAIRANMIVVGDPLLGIGSRWRHLASRTVRTIIEPPKTGWHPGDIRSRDRSGQTYVGAAVDFLAAHRRVAGRKRRNRR